MLQECRWLKVHRRGRRLKRRESAVGMPPLRYAGGSVAVVQIMWPRVFCGFPSPVFAVIPCCDENKNQKE